MKLPHLLLIAAVFSVAGTCWASDELQGRCRIVISAEASRPESVAAQELAKYLARLYPHTRFDVGNEAIAESQLIYLGTRESVPESLKSRFEGQLKGPESYVIRKATVDGRACGVIRGRRCRHVQPAQRHCLPGRNGGVRRRPNSGDAGGVRRRKRRRWFVRPGCHGVRVRASVG